MLPGSVKLIIHVAPVPVYTFQQSNPRQNHNHATMQEQCGKCTASDATNARLYCQLWLCAQPHSDNLNSINLQSLLGAFN